MEALPVLLPVGIVLVLATVVILVLRFAGKGVHPLASFATGYGWLVAGAPIALAPADIYSTLAEQPNGVLPSLWSASYWSMFVLTWAILPVVQEFAAAGDFTNVQKLRSSLKVNIYFYLVLGALIVAGVVLLIITDEFDFAALSGLTMSAANAFGLSVGLAVLGYGLVEVPRAVWRSAGLATRREFAMLSLGRACERRLSAERAYRRARAIVESIRSQTSRRDELRPYVDIVASDAAKMPIPEPNSSLDSEESQAADDELDTYDGSEASLAALRRRLTFAAHAYTRTRAEAAGLVARAAAADAALAEADSGRPVQTVSALWTRVLEPLLLRLLAVLLACMSIAVVLAESTIMTGGKPNLSVFSILIANVCDSALLTYAAVLVPLAYMLTCAYYSMFQLQLFNAYSLTPGHSDSSSLLLNAAMLDRFAGPLAYNFLAMVHAPPYSRIDGSEKLPWLRDPCHRFLRNYARHGQGSHLRSGLQQVRSARAGCELHRGCPGLLEHAR